MNGQLLAALGITLLQFLVAYAVMTERKKIEKMLGSITIGVQVDDKSMEMHLDRFAAQIKEAIGQDTQKTYTGLNTAEVISQVTAALEIITLDKTKDVKMIISSNQEGFEIKTSFRPV